jgi:hypothetical protein
MYGGLMLVDCDATEPSIQLGCTYEVGQAFPITVHMLERPVGGYSAWQAKVSWSDEQLEYLPAVDIDDEKLWPECDLAARANNQDQTNVGRESGAPSVLYGCVSFPVRLSFYTGPLLQLQLRCDAAGLSRLELVPMEGDVQLGTHALDQRGNAIVPALKSAGVECVDPASDIAGQSAPPAVAPAALPATGEGDGSSPNAALPLLIMGSAVVLAGFVLLRRRTSA